MKLNPRSSVWWGPPKKFDTHFEERKISWLELFFDLVYVIAISRITHRLSMHLGLEGFIEYCGQFALIFWGWVNGSLYHDLHGNEGLRTRLMTLWQMMIIAALAITIDHQEAAFSKDTTIAFMVMQIFITYLWWSVGIYDKEHRKYNKPYTVIFLLSFALMGLHLFLHGNYASVIFPVIILLNYIPPFIASRILHRSSLELSLSSSMTERLGLFTIIVFGEVVLGVVNGVCKLPELDLGTLLNFALALSLVFSLWWMFFAIVSNKEAKKGFVNATLLEMLCIPTLVSLGLIGASFSHMFDSEDHHTMIGSLNETVGYALAIFLTCVCVMVGMLEYPDNIKSMKGKVRGSLFITALVFLISAWLSVELATGYYLISVVVILVIEIYYLNSLYYTLKLDGDQAS